MSGLTVTEKNHWRDRIVARLDRRFETILAADPGLISRIQGEARSRALESLGLSEHQAELDSVAQQKAALDKRERRIRRSLLAQVRGVPVEDIEETRYFGPHDHELDTAIAKRQHVYEEQLLTEHQVGRQVFQLRAPFREGKLAGRRLAGDFASPGSPAMVASRRTAGRQADRPGEGSPGDQTCRRGGWM